jgi:hypothetical protein
MTLLQAPLPWDRDALDAERYWRDREWKKYAVDVSAGPERRPTFQRTFYAHCRSGERAIATVKTTAISLPSRARFVVRLAGPRELGCVPTGDAA